MFYYLSILSTELLKHYNLCSLQKILTSSLLNPKELQLLMALLFLFQDQIFMDFKSSLQQYLLFSHIFFNIKTMGKFQPLPLVNFGVFFCLTFEELKKAQPHTGTSVYLRQKLLDKKLGFQCLVRIARFNKCKIQDSQLNFNSDKQNIFQYGCGTCPLHGAILTLKIYSLFI